MPPPDRIPTDLVRVDGRPLEFVTAPLVADGVTSPLLGVSLVPSGADALSALGGNSFTAVDPSPGFSSNESSPGLFRSINDFMTGGNRTHNAEVDALITQAAIERLERERGQTLGTAERAEIRRYVHDLLPEYKRNTSGQRNGNVDPSDFPEILDHTLSHFGMRVRSEGPRVVESNEDMNWRIEELIEREMMMPGNEALWSDPNFETIRATLRTRLRAEFSGMLMNEWGSERLEDVNDFLKSGIVADFEGRAEGIISNGIASAGVCTMAEAVPPAPAVTPSAWSEVISRPLPARSAAP